MAYTELQGALLHTEGLTLYPRHNNRALPSPQHQQDHSKASGPYHTHRTTVTNVELTALTPSHSAVLV